MRILSLIGVLLLGFGPVHVATRAYGQERPLLLAHYMPWYQAKPHSPAWGWHWTMNHFNPDQLGDEGRRSIASHYYPLTGPYDSRDPDLLEYHALLMKVSGVDGVIVDWYGREHFRDYAQLHEATQALFATMERAGLGFAICYEDQTVGHMVEAGRLQVAETLDHAKAELQFAASEWMQSETYVRLDDRPILLNFGPQYFRQPGHWENILGAVGMDLHFYSLHERLGTVASGAFAWPPMHDEDGGVLYPSRLNAYLEIFYAFGQSVWPSYVGAAFPGFHDIYAEAGAQESYGYLDAREGATFRETLDRAVQAKAPIIQLVTWNDFGEGTNIEPTLEYGYRYLAEVRRLRVSRDSTFPYSEADLELPFQIYTLRKDAAPSADVQARVDQAVQFLLDGAPNPARTVLTELTTGAEDAPRPDTRLAVSVYPNPTSGAVTIEARAVTGIAVVEVYDPLGRRVTRLAGANAEPGTHTFVWNTAPWHSGPYFIRVQSADAVHTVPVAVRR